MFHDLGHLLSGYGTAPEGEIQQAAFQAGFSRHDGFPFLLFGIVQFHLGLRLTPIAQAERGFFDVQRVLRAVERGAACNQDIAELDLFAHNGRAARHPAPAARHPAPGGSAGIGARVRLSRSSRRRRSAQ